MKYKEGYSLIDSLFFDSDHFSSARLEHKEHLCAPEVFNLITAPYSEPVVQNLSKCDIFSLGLTILTLLVGKLDMKRLYNREELRMDHEYLQELLQAVEEEKKVGRPLAAVLKLILKEDELCRPSPQQLQAVLKRWDNNLRIGVISPAIVCKLLT